MAIKYVAIVLAIVFATADAKPYSKFGRTCRDIGCRSDEQCVMAEEPCNYSAQRDQCGRYPTCQRTNSGGESCTTKICPSGQYCRTENGRPTCVNTNAGLVGYDSAGVSSVNGQKQPSSGGQPAVPPADTYYGTRYANGNPYANANAPPAEEVFGNNNRNNNSPPSNNNGYPPYPSGNNNNNNRNYGYPPYPGSNNGYPAYPSNNNNNNNNGGYPPYPGNGRPNQHNYPQMNPVWNDVHQNSVYQRRNGASGNAASLALVVAVSLAGYCLRIIKA